MTIRGLFGRVVVATLVSIPAGTPGSHMLARPAGTSGQISQRDTPMQPVSGTGALAGTVVTNDGRSSPVRRALVTLSNGNAGREVQVVTDDAGRFAFAALPAGRYTVTAEKRAYVKTFHGSRRPGRGPASPIALADGQRVTDITIRLLRGAVIAGTVTDESGIPVASAQVRAFSPTIVSGERKLVSAMTAEPWATTDSPGRYRLYGLPPGEYTVMSGGAGLGGQVRVLRPADIDAATRELRGAVVPPDPDSQLTRGVAYYPSAVDPAGASFFKLGPGEERGEIDLRFTLVRSVRVEGVIVGPGGQPIQNVLIGLANAGAGSFSFSPGFIRPGADGKFALSSVPPGRYVFFGRGAESNVQNAPMMLWGETEVTVNEQNVSGVVIQFQPGSSVSGRFTFLGSPAIPSLTTLRVALSLIPVIPGAVLPPPAVTPQSDGTFTVTGVGPGRYRVTVTGAGRWSLRSAMLNGRDTLDAPLEIQPGQTIADLAVNLTDQPATISGTLFDQLGRPAPEYAVVVFSADRAHWTTTPRRLSGLIKLASDGKFTVVGLPPGEYYLAALGDVEPAQLADPAFLDLLVPAAIKITLGEGEKKTQDVKLGGGGATVGPSAKRREPVPRASAESQCREPVPRASAESQCPVPSA